MIARETLDRLEEIRAKRAESLKGEKVAGRWRYKPVALTVGDVDFLLAAFDAAAREAADLQAAGEEVVAAAEALSRPGVVAGSIDEMVRAARVTNALQELARLLGVSGVIPEAEATP